MHDHSSNARESDTGKMIIIRGSDRPPGLFRRVLGWLGQVVLWILAITPGLLIIRYGLGGVITEKLVGVRGANRTSYGDTAVGWGWIFIAVGFWGLGLMLHLKTGRAGIKYFSWVFTAGAAGIGCWILLQKLLRVLGVT